MQWGLFSLQIPAGLFCGGTRVCFFLRVHARAFFLWYSLYFVFGEGETPLLQRRCFSPSPTPSLSSSTGARRGVLHAAEFLCRSLQGASAVARAWCFTRGSPRGVYCVCMRGFFSLVFSVICFWGGRDTSSSEALFLSLPNPLPLFQHWGSPRRFACG